MKSIIGAIVLAIIMFSFRCANNDDIYDSAYRGKLYDKPYGGKPVGRYEDGKVYDKHYGGSDIGRTENKDGSGYWLLKKKGEKEEYTETGLYRMYIICITGHGYISVFSEKGQEDSDISGRLREFEHTYAASS